MSIEHDHGSSVVAKPLKHLDYSLTGENASRAIERGLAEADWYQCPVPRKTMRALLERRDGPALRDTALWFGLIFGTGILAWNLWPSVWFLLPYLAYCVLYGSTSDSRWHEAGHGTAFKTDWLNNALYEIASFMVMRESVVWRWSHTRHHSDTIIVGRDPEIAVPRPPDLKALGMSFFNLGVYPKYFRQIVLHAFGRMSADEKTFIPESEFPKIFRNARIYLAIYLGVIGLAIGMGSILPLLFVGLPNLFGSWLMVVYGLTQHAGLAENVLDHRLNCRTVYMNPIHRFLYWNMNYHVEHHMFPLVPYHALPRLHAAVKHDCPEPYPSLLAAWCEILPAVIRQVRDPAYHVKRKLPAPTVRAASPAGLPGGDAKPDEDGWIEVCAAADLGFEDVIRFDHGRKTFALVRDAEGSLHATDGMCTHGNTHLADGLVKDGIIECPKHNGRFNLADGSPARAPICRGLATYPIEERAGRIWLNLSNPGGAGARDQKTVRFRVVSNRNVATFIKELVLEPGDEVTAIGPFGDFHIKPTQKEMIYIGGGAGMAPLRAHISHLLETENTARKISYWYGARSRQEVFYEDYFAGLANEHPNFEFHIALSSPLPEDNWSGATGFIHDVVNDNRLANHPNLAAVEFYLCGPPMMIKACTKMLAELGVANEQIAFDEF